MLFQLPKLPKVQVSDNEVAQRINSRQHKIKKKNINSPASYYPGYSNTYWAVHAKWCID